MKGLTGIKISGNAEDRIFDTVNYIVLFLLMVVTLYPFLNTLAISINDSVDTLKGGLHIFPRKFTLINYRTILNNSKIYHATIISILRALTGSLLNVVVNMMVAYGLSRKDYVLRKFITRIFLVSMYVSGGLIPTYFLIRDLGLANNFLVYIIPGMVSAWNIMIMRSYISGLPESLIESAKIDGASEYRILFSIVFPLCLPVIASIILFVAVGQWNSWFDTMIYCSQKQSLSTLQYELQKVLESNSQLATNAEQLRSLIANAQNNHVDAGSIRAAMTIVATLPILMVYPFLQKYFVKGLTLGGVKG